MPTFYHSGSLGDQIYSLPTVKALGGGTFVSGMSFDAFMSIEPLLRAQECIKHVFHVNQKIMQPGWIDLSSFRNHPLFTRMHIADLHAEMQQIKIDKTVPWLWSGLKHRFPSYGQHPFAVVAVTPRYRDAFFRWSGEIKYLTRQVENVYYIGSLYEFQKFKLELDHVARKLITYLPTDNLLEAADVIHDALYFSGNQSVPLAIRQACAKSWRFEQSPNHRDTEQGTEMETKLNPYTRRIHLAVTCIKRAIFDNQYQRV